MEGHAQPALSEVEWVSQSSGRWWRSALHRTQRPKLFGERVTQLRFRRLHFARRLMTK